MRRLALFVTFGSLLGQGPVAIEFGPETFNVDVDGTAVPFTTKGVIHAANSSDGGLDIGLQFDSDMTGLQRQLPAIIQKKMNASENCGARVDIHTIAVTPQNRNAILAMKGHYENWKCPPAGFMWLSKRPPQKIYEQNGAARFRLEAKASPDGAGLEITPELESVDVEGMLGKLLKTFFIGPFIRDILIHRIMQSVNAANLKRTFPPALAEFKPQMQAARFTDIGGGKLGLSVNMTLHVNKAQAGGLLRRIVEQAR